MGCPIKTGDFYLPKNEVHFSIMVPIWSYLLIGFVYIVKGGSTNKKRDFYLPHFVNHLVPFDLVPTGA